MYTFIGLKRKKYEKLAFVRHFSFNFVGYAHARHLITGAMFKNKKL